MNGVSRDVVELEVVEVVCSSEEVPGFLGALSCRAI